YLATLFGVLVGGFYSFRLVFYAFHGKERFNDPDHPDVKELEAERAAAQAAEQAAHAAAVKDAHVGDHGDTHAHADHKNEHKHDDHAHDDHGHHGAPHESPWVVTLPLVLLAIPSVCAGWVIGTFLYGNYFGEAIHFSEAHPVMEELKAE